MKSNLSDKNLFSNGDEQVGVPAKAEKLFEQQIENWKLARDGYKSLESVEIKQFDFENYTIEAHYNSGRIISSSAKVDDRSINARPCFLCLDNLPEDQKLVKLFGDYILLLNPYPIFDKHFTIPSVKHIPQAIFNDFGNMLGISSMLGKNYIVFYNGPRCGASAPDHLHFQAGNFGFMKIDTEFENVLKVYGEIIFENDEIKISAINDGLRKYFSLESSNKLYLESEFKKIYNMLEKISADEEPMMNIICGYNNMWRVLIYPRSKHRPSYFFMEGKDKILISPAAVDLGGILIFPRQEDFEKVTKDLIVDIFHQISVTDRQHKNYIEKLKNF